MKTPILQLIEWIDKTNNSQSSELELKMLAQFRAKLVEKLPLEEEFQKKQYNQAITDAIINAQIKEVGCHDGGFEDYTWVVDHNSILKLKKL